MKMSTLVIGDAFVVSRLMGWRFFRFEGVTIRYGRLNGAWQFNHFFGVKIGPSKLWLGRHTSLILQETLEDRWTLN
jgi:hypothetical protein